MIERRVAERALDMYFPKYEEKAIVFREEFSSVIGREVSSRDVVKMFFDSTSSQNFHYCCVFPKFIIALGFNPEETTIGIKEFNKGMREMWK